MQCLIIFLEKDVLYNISCESHFVKDYLDTIMEESEFSIIM